MKYIGLVIFGIIIAIGITIAVFSIGAVNQMNNALIP